MQSKKVLIQSFLRYLLPSIASLVSLSLYILADTYFIANGVGSIGLAALNLALPAYSLINALGLMCGVGGGIIIAVSRGNGDRKKAQRAFQCASVMPVLFSLIFVLIGIFLSDQVAVLLGASEQSFIYTKTYAQVILLFAPAFMLNGALCQLVRNDENPRLSMISMFINSMLNVVLDYLFVMVFEWGMFGAAIATGISASSGIATLSLHWILKKNTLRFALKLPDISMAISIARGGASNFIIEMGNGLVLFLFNFTLLRLSEDIAVAAYGIVANTAFVVSYIFVGVGQGMQPLLGEFFGAGKKNDAVFILRMGIAVSIVLGIIFFSIGQLIPSGLASLFNKNNDPVLQEMTIRGIRLYFSAFIFMGVNVSLCSYYQSTLRVNTSLVLSLMRACVLIIIALLVLPAFLGLDGVWLVVPCAEFAAFIIGITTYCYGRVKG